MKRIYYSLWYRLDNKDRYLIWFTRDVNESTVDPDADDADGVVHENGTIPIFITPTELMNYTQAKGLNPVEIENPTLHNLDVVARWLKVKKRKRVQHLDCEEFLCAWNLFGDISASIGDKFNADKQLTRKIYSKLSWGNNLPSMTPPGKFYVPLWSVRELEIIHEVMDHGLSMFRSNTKRL